MNYGNITAKLGISGGRNLYVSPSYNTRTIERINRAKKISHRDKIDLTNYLNKNKIDENNLIIKKVSTGLKSQNLRYEPINNETLKIVFLDGSMLVGVYIDKIV